MASEKPDIHAIFNEAIEKGSKDECLRYLDAACGNDPKVRGRVQALLRAHSEAGDFFGGRSPAVVATIDRTDTEKLGGRIGPYKLLEQVGEGGMGTVYVAEQIEPVRRKVALKVIKAGMDTAQVVARFEAERQALALMNHPNIAQVLDAGATESGRPYFVMELVKGIPITQYCDRHKLDLRQRLELFVNVCQAVQHAHHKGVIHRDLKPSNVLVELHDVTAVVKVIDFGVAKATNQRLTERTLHTGVAQMIGTPQYMSPEQAELSGADVDTRSDIYSLGVLLYELLTGTTPFSKEQLAESGFDEMRRIIREREPLKPSEQVSTLKDAALSTVADREQFNRRPLTQLLRGELDWIVMKALEKDRNRRYENASSFATDVQRYLGNEPVEASPPSSVYRLRKLASRHKATIAFSGALMLALLMGLVGTTWQVIRATHAEDNWQNEAQRANQEADAARNAEALALALKSKEEAAREEAERNREEAVAKHTEAERNRYYAEMQLALHDWDEKNIPRMHQLLENYLPRAEAADHRDWEWYYLFSRCHLEERTLHGCYRTIRSVAWSPDGELIAGASHGGTIVWDAKTASIVRSFLMDPFLTGALSWSPDSRYLAWSLTDSEDSVRMWDRRTDETELLEDHGRVVFSPMGDRYVSRSKDHVLTVWDLETRERISTFREHTHQAFPLLWKPDGSQIASYAESDGLRIWDSQIGEEVDFEHPPVADRRRMSLSWSPDGRFLLVHRSDGIWAFYDAENGRVVKEFESLKHVSPKQFSPQGDRIVAKDDACVFIVNSASGEIEQEFLGHLAPIQSIDWDPTGTRVVSADTDGAVKIWSLSEQTLPAELRSPKVTNLRSLMWIEDWDRLASVSRSGHVINLWNGADGSLLKTFSGREDSVVSISFDGKLLASTKRSPGERTITIRELLTDQILAELPTERVGEMRWVEWSPDRSMVAISDRDDVKRRKGQPTDSIEVWNVQQQKQLFTWDESILFGNFAWSPDNRFIAVVGYGDVADPNGYTRWLPYFHLLDVEAGRRIDKTTIGHQQHGVAPDAVAWSPDSRLVGMGDRTGTITVFDPSEQKRISQEHVHTHQIRALAWSPDGLRLASAGLDGKLVLTNPHTGQTVFSVKAPIHYWSQLAWDAAGERLALIASNNQAATLGDRRVGGPHGVIRILDASLGYEFFRSEERDLDLARIYAHLPQREERTANLARAIELSPADPVLLARRSLAYIAERKWEQALQDADRAIELEPGEGEYRYYRGLIKSRLARWPEAAKEFEEYAKSFPFYPIQAISLTALAHQQAENLSAARSILDRYQPKLLDHDPYEQACWLWSWAIVNRDESPTEELLTLAEQSAQEHPPMLIIQLAWSGMLYRAGRIDDAIRTLRQTAEPAILPSKTRERACFWCLLAMAHQQLGNINQADAYFAQAESALQEITEAGTHTGRESLMLELALKTLLRESGR